jgi:hypothetical protein
VNTVVAGGGLKKFTTVGATKVVAATCWAVVVPGPMWVIR